LTSQDRSARRLVVAFRILLLLLAAAALAAALVIGRLHDGAAGDSGARYVCPMHPDVVAAEPGLCPICRMELEPVHGTGAHPATVNPSTFQAYDFVRRRGLGQDLRAPAWVDGDGFIAALLYRDELAALMPEERVVFSPSTAPSAGVEVHPAPEPPTPWDRSTSRVRFQVGPHATAPAPPAGEVGWVRLAPKRLELQVVPYSAVLEAAEGPYVLVASSDGRTLTKRPVEIGRVLGGTAVVLSGLRYQERILVRSAFFVDAERRLHREAAIELTP
jgi:hypothetical protein